MKENELKKECQCPFYTKEYCCSAMHFKKTNKDKCSCENDLEHCSYNPNRFEKWNLKK